MTLTQELATSNAAGRARIPADKLAVIDKASQQLTDSNIEAAAPKVGDVLPDVTLPGVDGKERSLSDLIAGKDNAVIAFYRGGWCPYCNIELRALQQVLPELTERNTALIAITPETPDNSLTTSEKHDLSFPVLSDLRNTYARQLGIVHTLPAELREVYGQFGLDIKKHNGDEQFELPLPATFVVDADRRILKVFAPADYTKRLDPVDILAALPQTV